MKIYSAYKFSLRELSRYRFRSVRARSSPSFYKVIGYNALRKKKDIEIIHYFELDFRFFSNKRYANSLILTAVVTRWNTTVEGVVSCYKSVNHER